MGFNSVMKTYFMKITWLRRAYYNFERFPPFFKVCLSKEGFGSSKGRKLIWGKFRRVTLSVFPSLCRALQKHYGLTGGCVSCGASCNLLFKCPHWDNQSRLCTVYEDRPNICRYFPITPGDIQDRDLVNTDKSCGFKFSKE